MAGKPRGAETVGDVVRSLVALCGVIAVVVISFSVMRPDDSGPRPVEYTGVLDRVRDEFPYPVVAPTPVPEGWTATSAEQSSGSSGNRWWLGFVTDDGGFVGLEQSDGEVNSFLDDRLEGFTEDGSSRSGGVTWERWLESDENPDRALVSVRDGVATVVLGTEPYAVLEAFAADLQP